MAFSNTGSLRLPRPRHWYILYGTKQKMTFYFASFEKWRCFLHRTQGVFQHPANVTDMQTVSVWG